MSVAHRPVELSARGAPELEARTLAVRWVVAAGALTPGARGTETVEVVVRRAEDGNVWVEAAVLHAASRRVVRTVGPLAAGSWWADDAGLEHVEAAPALRATVSEGGVLFAQTDVLEGLGVAGGRYDRAR